MTRRKKMSSQELHEVKFSETGNKVFSVFTDKEILKHVGYGLYRIRKSRKLLRLLNDMALCRIEHTKPNENSFIENSCTVLSSSAFSEFLESETYSRCWVSFYRDSGTIFISGRNCWDKQITLCFSEEDMRRKLMRIAAEVGQDGKTTVVDPCAEAVDGLISEALARVMSGSQCYSRHGQQ